MTLKSRVKELVRKQVLRFPGLASALLQLFKRNRRIYLGFAALMPHDTWFSGVVQSGPLQGAEFEQLLFDELYPVLFNSMEPRCSELLLALDLRGKNVFDIGASYGYYAVLLSRCVGQDGQVFTFEPDVHSYRRLLGNLALNNCTNVLPMPYAVSSTTGIARWSLAGAEPWLGHIANAADTSNTLPVVTVSLDALVAAPPLSKTALIKMDVEGAEADIIESAGRVLSTIRPLLLIELHSAAVAARVRAVLDHSQYQTYLVEYVDDTRQHVFSIPSELASRYETVARSFALEQPT